MKKILFTLALLFIFQYSFSQARIGYTKQQIKNEFLYKKKVEEKVANDGTPYLSIEDKFGSDFYYLDDYNICVKYVFVAKNNDIVNQMIKALNEDYIKISDYEWRRYSNGVYIIAKLKYHKELEIPYFEYTQD